MNFTNKEPIFIQIAEYYKKLISAGAYKYNEALPSVRDVALDLIVNPNTVQRAFSKLVEDHYAINIPKKGYYVCYQKPGEKSNLLIQEKIDELLKLGYTLDNISDVIKTMKQEKTHND